MAAKRARDRDLKIPAPKNPANRQRALDDAEFFLQHYFGNVFTEPFTEDRRDMLVSIENAALYGGDQAIAGPRGEGKTRLVLYQGLRLAIKGISRFPIVIGKSQSKAEKDLKTIREKLQQNQLFIDDFPEIGYPFKAIGGWSSRCRLQTVSGVFTQIEIAPDHLIFPTIEPWQLEWGDDFELLSRGQIFACMGIDGPIRGTTYRDERPTVAIIDDIEDKEAARSETLIERNESIIEEDIGGLGSSAEPIARVFLCTIQNRKCIAYKYTDQKAKPSWRGRRYRKMIKPPGRMDLVEQFIELWKNRKDDDTDAREAYRFWRDNREEIERGCVISNPYSYSRKTHSDGEPMELSAIHSYYVRVAKYGAKAVATEIDNDPPEESQIETSGLTAHKVASRISGLSQGQYHVETEQVTIGLDIGKYYSHWVKIGWHGNAVGNVIDYGVMETPGMGSVTDAKAVMAALLPALHQWRTDMLADSKLDFCFIDSGDYSDAVYEFVRQVGGTPFAAAKGWDTGRYRQPLTESNDKKPFNECYAARQPEERLWLYHVHTEHWKQWVQERFITSTFNDQAQFNDGSLSLYASEDKKRHTSYSHHIVAEERQEVFVPGKGLVRKWVVVNRNNHYLDATALACAAAGCLGVRIVPRVALQVAPKPQMQQHRPSITNPYGQPFLATERK